MKELNNNEKPREKLSKYGASILTDVEILALLISTGHKERGVIELSRDVLKIIEDNGGVNELTYEELIKIKGIGSAKAAILIAALEFGKRLSKKELKYRITNPEMAFEYLKDLFEPKQEELICIYLDSKSNVIKHKKLFRGTTNVSIVHPREIFKWAVKYSCNSFIIAHNHPSGDITPSQDDIDVTKQIQELSSIFSITFIDHLIIADDIYVSLKSMGHII